VKLLAALGLDAAGIEASIRARFESLLHTAPGLKVVG
jgi:1-deoxy-D-xylulose-5-phosphate synthase